MVSKKDKARDFLEEAASLARNRYYREALYLYQSVWALDPSNLDALYGMAGCYYRLRNFGPAERYARLLVERLPESPRAARLLRLIRRDPERQKEPGAEALLPVSEETYVDEDLQLLLDEQQRRTLESDSSGDRGAGTGSSRDDKKI